MILDAFEALSEQAEVFTLAPYTGPYAGRFEKLGPLAILPYGPGHLSRTRLIKQHFYLRRKSQLESAIKNWKPDLIYVNSVAALPCLPMLSLPDIPVLLHVHELEAITKFFLADNASPLWNIPARFIACSEAVREFLETKHQIPADKIAVIHEFAPDALAKYQKVHAAQPTRPFVVGGAGLPHLRKGVTLWLQMAKELIRLVGAERVRFVWVGVKPDADSLQFMAMASKLGVESQVEFIPATPEPLPHFMNFDAFAMTSWEDPCPIVVLEAMLVGLPVACFSGSGGAPEEVGNTGLVVPDFSPLLMAQGFAALVNDREKAAQMGLAARARALARFTASAQVPKILREMRRLTGIS